MKIKFKWDKQLDDKILKALQAGLTAAAIDVEARAKNNCPVDTGDLRQSITRKVEGTQAVIYSDKEYAANVEYLTKPHIIEAKNKKVLYNPRTGQFFGKRVMHPGSRGVYFMRRALFENWKKIQSIVRRIMKKLLS